LSSEEEKSDDVRWSAATLGKKSEKSRHVTPQKMTLVLRCVSSSLSLFSSRANRGKRSNDDNKRRCAFIPLRARKGLLAEKFDDGKEEVEEKRVEKADNERECGCGSGNTYEVCCKPMHAKGGITRETTPEQIVRARFTSYKENKPEFIVESTHEASPDFSKRMDGDNDEDMKKARETLESDARATAKKIRFLSLKIMKKGSGGDGGGGDGDEAFVSYECAFDAGEKRAKKSRAKAKTLAERARYRKDEDGKWKYVDALQLNDNVLSADGFDDGGHNRGKSNWGNGNLGKIF
jgi:uncharacterized protein YchJ